MSSFHLLAHWTRVTALMGETARAWAAIRRYLPKGAATTPGEAIFATTVALQRLAGALALEVGDLPEARTWLEAHDHWLAWSGAVLWRAEGALGWAAYHRAAGMPREARQHVEAALAYAAEPRQPLAVLAAHRALGELDTEEGHHAAAAMHLGAAHALAEACAAPYERALILLALAELRLAIGDSAGAQSALEEARARLEPLGAKLALARADALAARLASPPPPATPPHATLPFSLSPREAEVLRLAARGLSNAEIAARLFLSPRTVTTHLTAVYTKLRVASRGAAIAVAIDHGLR